MVKTECPKHVQPRCYGLLFGCWCYGVAAWVLSAFVLRGAPGSFRVWAFAAAIVASYAMLYTLPTLGAIWVAKRARRWGGGLVYFSDVVVILIASITQLLLAADFVIHGLFGFHINGFVLNLIATPEGVASMGAGPETIRMYGWIAAAMVVVNAMIWFASNKRLVGTTPRWVDRGIAVAVIVLAAGERISYGIAYNQAWPDFMAVASTVPGYQPITFRSLAKRMGFEMQRRTSLDAPGTSANLAYPLHPLETAIPANPPNLVIFVCESLRADMLTSEIMPKTWAFAQQSQQFTHHYSGGNGTRMGMFTAFYGLPGNYWFNFLRNRRPPVLMDRLQQLNYDMRLSTSAAFSYPEFDKTILAHIPAGDLHPHSGDEGWMSDRYNVARMKEWLGKKQDQTPFFLFHFFESPHARYYFPPESVIRRPYLEDLNYATVNLKRDIELIRNRYINAVHHLDSQLGDMIDALRATGRLENTIVVITGDHGEEFMENGRWGHNSEFSEQQIRVPLVIHMPGQAPTILSHRTSHVDLVPTILPALGVTNPSSDYSTGTNLFSSTPRLLTFADWDRIAISDGIHKVVFPINAGGRIQSRVTKSEDQPVANENATLKQMGAAMVTLKNMMSQFVRKHG